jgi:molybdopterin-guanine dinucleotide biosynthesis protein A
MVTMIVDLSDPDFKRLIPKQEEAMIRCTGVLLSGGQNSRMSGVNKANIQLGNKKIIEHMLAIFKDCFEDVILVTNSPLDYLNYDVSIVSDILPAKCSLSGIHTGLFHAPTDWIFVAPCDTPFLRPEMVRLVTARISSQYNVVIPQTSAGYEPLCAAYSKANLHRIETNLSRNVFTIRKILKPGKTRIVPESLLTQADPGLNSFFNINSPEDLEKAKKMKSIE